MKKSWIKGEDEEEEEQCQTLLTNFRLVKRIKQSMSRKVASDKFSTSKKVSNVEK